MADGLHHRALAALTKGLRSDPSVPLFRYVVQARTIVAALSDAGFEITERCAPRLAPSPSGEPEPHVCPRCGRARADHSPAEYHRCANDAPVPFAAPSGETAQPASMLRRVDFDVDGDELTPVGSGETAERARTAIDRALYESRCLWDRRKVDPEEVRNVVFAALADAGLLSSPAQTASADQPHESDRRELVVAWSEWLRARAFGASELHALRRTLDFVFPPGAQTPKPDAGAVGVVFDLLAAYDRENAICTLAEDKQDWAERIVAALAASPAQTDGERE